jgi:hypothetical protein
MTDPERLDHARPSARDMFENAAHPAAQTLRFSQHFVILQV